MHSFQTRLKISIYKRKLFVFFPVRAPSEYLIVFLSSSSSSLNAKDRSFSSCFHRTQKVSFHFHYFGYCFACSYVFCLKNLFTFFLAKIILLLSKFDKIYRQRGKVSNFEDNYLN